MQKVFFALRLFGIVLLAVPVPVRYGIDFLRQKLVYTGFCLFRLGAGEVIAHQQAKKLV